jgi:hypothetical protein
VNGEEQPAKVTLPLRAGDVLRIETPGGGAWGLTPASGCLTPPETGAWPRLTGFA